MTRVVSDLREIAQRLRQWMAGQPSFGLDIELLDVELQSRGQSSDMMALTCRQKGQDKHFILRREPRARQLFLEPSVIREFAIMRALELEGAVPVPPMLACEADETVLGAPFLVMGKVEGFVPMGRPSIHVAGPLVDLPETARRRLWLSAMKGLVAIHAVDWRSLPPFGSALPSLETPLRTYLQRLSRWYEWAAAGRQFLLTDAALAYLKAGCTKLEDERSVLLWNDARVGNMIFAPDGNLAAVIDWEGATVGPAAIDFGYWVMFDEFQAEAIGVERLPGLPDRDKTVRTYEALSGYRLEDLDYFVVMAAFNVATTLIRQADLAIAAGRYPPDSRMGHDNTTTQIIARQLGLPVPNLSPDFIAHRQLHLLDGLRGERFRVASSRTQPTPQDRL